MNKPMLTLLLFIVIAFTALPSCCVEGDDFLNEPVQPAISINIPNSLYNGDTVNLPVAASLPGQIDMLTLSLKNGAGGDSAVAVYTACELGLLNKNSFTGTVPFHVGKSFTKGKALLSITVYDNGIPARHVTATSNTLVQGILASSAY